MFGEHRGHAGGLGQAIRVPALAGLALIWLAVGSGCAGAGGGVAGAGGSKIGFDVSQLNVDGVYGPADGLRALDYEYCIPDKPQNREQVLAIDPTARFMPGSKGRIGCGPGQVLVLGHTHQRNYRGVLQGLSTLPFVSDIERASFE
jgi:hypothetical protein